MQLDFNRITLTGRVFDMGLSPTKQEGVFVAEGKISVRVAQSKDNKVLRDDFSIRAYGNKAKALGVLKDGTRVILEGKIKEDLRINADNPDTLRSKVYVNVDNFEIVGGYND